MLIFTRANLALFAVPKTGSTAYHLALRNHAQIVFAQDTSLKHLTLRKYDRHFAPYLQEAHGLTPERVAVMRDPIEQVRSWYRYRLRPRVSGGPNDLSHLSFDEFVADVISRDPPDHARIGSQFTFLTSPEGALRVDHLFAYERPNLFKSFLEERLKKTIKPQQKNVSPSVDAPLSATLRDAFIAARPDEWALYQTLTQAGGHLKTPVTG